ncbi:MAG: sigma-70 family RNA polymerase sigma factor [Bacteroidales bacterium]|nr:sigma-70 family RNA polymerase sigma factor [Bacteroidales bacterium]
MEQVDREIIKGLASGDQQAYDMLIRLYFQPLVIYAGSIVNDVEHAKDIVQDIFLKIWSNHSVFNVTTSLRSYLFRTVHNSCIDHLRSEKAKSQIKAVSYDDQVFREKVYDIQSKDSFFNTLFHMKLIRNYIKP